MDVGRSLTACNALAENLDLNAIKFALSQLQAIGEDTSTRAVSCRYRDPPEIRNLIASRRELTGREAREKAKEVLVLRKAAKAAWLQDLLEKAVSGNFFAVNYFKRRQGLSTQMQSYILKAGGYDKAANDMKAYYRRNFDAREEHPEAQLALAQDHCPHIVDFLNDVLTGARSTMADEPGSLSPKTPKPFAIQGPQARSFVECHVQDVYKAPAPATQDEVSPLLGGQIIGDICYGSTALH